MNFGDVWNYGKYANPAIGLGVESLQRFMPATGQPGMTPQEQELMARNKALADREQAAYGQQQDLSNLLFLQATGQGPSLATAQLGAGLEQINRQQMSNAAGVGGNGGILARYAAMNNAAGAGAAANQAGALARADEIAKARALLGHNLGTMAGQSADLYKTNLSGFTGLRDIDAGIQKSGNETKAKYLGAGLSFLGGAGATGAVG